MSAIIQSAQATRPVLAPKSLERQRVAPQSLRLPLIVTFLSALLAVGLGLSGYFYLKNQQLNFVTAKNAKADAQARLSAAAAEQIGLEVAQPNYTELRAKGIFVAEARMEFIETLNSLKRRHQLVQLEYSIEPQRALILADGKNYPAIDLLASRVNFMAHADHDAELLAFIGAFAALNRGVFPLQQCRIARNAPPARTRFGAAGGAGGVINDGDNANRGATANAAAALSARCALDWITLRDKAGGVATSTELKK